jgi:hypothetical protein
VESLALENDKRKKGRRLNICGEESSSVKIYSPSKVVQAGEYIAEKDAKEQAIREAKEARKVQRAANGLIQKQKEAEKEARQAAAQLAQELHMSNPALPKSPKKTPAKTPKKAVVVEEVEEVVVQQNSRGRAIKLLKRFKSKI